MCSLCDETKRKFPVYVFCPYCGKNFNEHGFVPTYVTKKRYDDADAYGRPRGLATTTLIKIK